MKNIFTDHPHRIGETYFQHFKFALIFSMNMIVGGIACLIHAIFPFLFPETGSHFLLKMTHRFIERMPVVEDRVKVISQSIEKKMKKDE
ncbi:MAG: hypothetical protein EPO11_05540 [Gammaproteobacteria bacterium]|nr:MAG: hypothetical protein EPO11_05540 [Gammaproteobacteria bacterium]